MLLLSNYIKRQPSVESLSEHFHKKLKVTEKCPRKDMSNKDVRLYKYISNLYTKCLNKFIHNIDNENFGLSQDDVKSISGEVSSSLSEDNNTSLNSIGRAIHHGISRAWEGFRSLLKKELKADFDLPDKALNDLDSNDFHRTIFQKKDVDGNGDIEISGNLIQTITHGGLDVALRHIDFFFNAIPCLLLQSDSKFSESLFREFFTNCIHNIKDLAKLNSFTSSFTRNISKGLDYFDAMTLDNSKKRVVYIRSKLDEYIKKHKEDLLNAVSKMRDGSKKEGIYKAIGCPALFASAQKNNKNENMISIVFKQALGIYDKFVAEHIEKLVANIDLNKMKVHLKLE